MAISEKQRGLIFVLVGPGGAGKNALMRAAIAQVPGLTQLATATTRPRRNDELEGREHYFMDTESFRQLIAEDALLEWQEVTPNKFYGIVRDRVETKLAEGHLLMADIEVLGARILRESYPDDVVLIFVTVPGETEEDRLNLLRQRMSNPDRNEAQSLIDTRIDRARTLELPFEEFCDYSIVNDDREVAVGELIGIIHTRLQERVEG